ncbi:hypothetical protein [Treponema vincentii]|uniref:hypothetical protein n=1 Tax=Treponema vincentii TaxID=69710 RepID=UPI003D9067DA
MKKMKRAVSFVLIVLAAITGFTCRPNIGLGGQIDIVPPEGEITYPDAGETPIRGSFVLKGTASDDDGIQSITVVFENIETKARSSVYTAEGFTVGSASASWTVNVANEATGAEEAPHELVKIYPIPDGEYTAILTVTDKGGKSTTVTKNYKIDNTPPVFIVSRPSTVVNISGDSDPQADGYGATFSVIGQAGERNTVEKLNVLIPDTTPLINLSNMFVGNNINAQVAVYGTEPNALYDLQAKDRSKPIKGQLYLYDNAREYKGDPPAGEGNKADWFYLWNEIYTDVIAKGYTPEVISDYFAGKKGSDKDDHDKKIAELRNDTVALNKLKSAMTRMSEKLSIFKLDPSKSPGFKVIGAKNLPKKTLNFVQASSMLFKAGSETSFSVELIRNKDNIPLVAGSDLEAYKKSNIEIVLLKWDGTGNELDCFKTGEHLTEKSLLKFSDLTDTGLITIENGNLRVKCTFNPAWDEGYYALQVKGTDSSTEESNRFAAYDDSNSVNDGIYIINFLAVGTGPRIRPIRPQTYQNANFEIFADITGIDSTGEVYYNIDAEVDAASPDTTKKLTKATPNPSDPKYKATIDISGLADGEHKIYFLVKAGSGATDADSTDFTVDKKAPVVEILSPNLSRSQSGDFTMRGSAVDTPSGVKSIKYIAGKQNSGDITVKPAETSSAWKPLDLSGDSWDIPFTGTDNITQKAKAQALGKKVEGLAAGVELYDIPVFFLVEDKAGESTQKGNTAIITKTIRVDPNGDIPEVTVLSPDAKQVLGGTIRISGTVSVPNPAAGTVGSVWIQITDKKDGSGNPDFNQNATFGTINWCPSPDGKQLTSYLAGNPYWSVEINGNKEFEPSTGTQRTIWFRLRGKNGKPTPEPGQWTEPVKIVVDKAAPTITGMKVATIGNIGTPIPSGFNAENQDYVSNMWIKGDNLYLCADLAHDAGIEQIDISGSYFGASTITLKDDSQITGSNINNSGKAWFTQSSVPSTTTAKNYKMHIPLKTTTNPGSNNGFTITIKIKAKKQGEVDGLTAQASFSLKYDNSTPTAVFGTKIASSGTIQVSETSFTDPALIGKTNINTSTKFFASGEDIAITGFDRSIGKVTLASAPAHPTKGYLIYAPIEYLRPDGSGKVGVFGAAYDVGAGVEKVKVNYNNASTTEIVLESPSGVQTDVGNGDVNFVTWKGVIDVNSYADGKGKIIITPIDRANNEHAPIEVPVKLKKNSLKISSVELGTDINRNGTIANAGSTVETKTLALTYDADKPNGIDSEKYDWHGKADADAFRFKNATSHIKVDISGGNGTKKYTLKCLTNGQDVHGLTELSAGVITLDAAAFTKIGQSDDLNTTNPKKRKLLLTLWDSAAGLSVGTNTWKAELELDVIVDTKDRIAPTNVIDPFKWVSKTENSLYGNSSDNGHIEIGTDLNTTVFNQTSGLMDMDDKVSGKISITGTAHDDQVIKEIWAKIDGFTFTGIAGAAEGAETKLATYTSGSFSDTGDFDTNGWHFSIVSNDLSVETGHTVKWKLDWNTAKISGGVGLDKTIAIKVKDESTETSHAVSATRRVDVVPYVSGLTTALSELGGNAPDLYARTALGRYPVKDGETIKVHGFNLTGAACTVGGVSCGTLSADGSSWKLTLSANAKSGALTATVGTIAAINNTNNNDKPYNKRAKTANNDGLTDDVYLDVWQFNSEAVKSKDASVTYPMMKIHPDAENNGRIGFAFANGTSWFSMASSSKSYTIFQKNWDLYQNVGFAYGPDGTSYGIASGTDVNTSLNPDTCSLATFFEVNPSGSYDHTDANYKGWGGIAFESIGLGDGNINKNRIQSPAIAAGQNVYIAYYDLLKKQLRFRTKNKIVNISTPLANPKDSNSGNYQIIVNGSTPFVALGVVSEFDTAGTATSDKAVVLAYYDAAPRKLKLKYKTALDVTTAWTDNDSVNFSGGQDVQLAVDRSGGIHLAYTTSSGDLAYAYSASYSGTFTEYIVDSYSLTGSRLTIDIANDTNGKPIPYIGYFMQGGGVPKLAYLRDGAVLEAGAKNDYYTGKWEVSVVPTPKAYDTYAAGNKVNVGVWKKKADGKLTNSKKENFVYDPSTGNDKGTSSGSIYGNGTSNPVLGYVIEEGTIETAQKK